MKILIQKSFKSLAFAATAVLFFATPVVMASACTDNCNNQATQAGQTAYASTYAQKYGVCYQMAPGAARDYCFSQVPVAAWSAYGQAYGQAYGVCMNSTHCSG